MAEAERYTHTATFEDIMIESVEMVYTKGISPSIATVIFSKKDDTPTPDTGALTFGLVEAETITISDMKVTDKTENRNAGDIVATVTLADRRWKWPFAGTITGRYNRRDDAGELAGVAAEQKTVKELAELLLDAMGEAGYTTTAIDDTSQPFIDWDYSRPALELENLLDPLGYDIVLDYATDLVSVVKRGTGVTTLDGVDLAISTRSNQKIIPGTLRMVTGPTHVQVKDIELTAVALDTDGTIKPLADISFKPAAGWSLEDAREFRDAKEFEKEKLYRDTVFRWYRLPDTLDVDGDTLDRETYLDRLLPDLVDQVVDDDTGEATRDKPFAKGRYFDAKAVTDSEEVDKADNARRVDVSFQIDKKRGLVAFGRQVHYINADESLSPAEIKLTAAFEKRDDDDRRVSDYTITGGGSAEYHVVPLPDIHPEIVDGAYGNVLTILAHFISTAIRTDTEFGAPSALPRTLQFAGTRYWPLDGNLNELTWSITSGTAATTTAALGDVRNARDALPRNFRRLLTQTTKERKDASRRPKTGYTPNGR